MRSPSAPVCAPCGDSEEQVEEARWPFTALPLSPALPLSLSLPWHAKFPVAQKIALACVPWWDACLVCRQVGMAVAVTGGLGLGLGVGGAGRAESQAAANLFLNVHDSPCPFYLLTIYHNTAKYNQPAWLPQHSIMFKVRLNPTLMDYIWFQTHIKNCSSQLHTKDQGSIPSPAKAKFGRLTLMRHNWLRGRGLGRV